ncbi:MAG: class IV adenylate cyclase [bacterium]
MRNIEIKARYTDFAFARKCVRQEGGNHHSTMQQSDVYFRVVNGRLKLRYLEKDIGYLVYYERDDNPEPRASEYYIYDTKRPAELQHLLSAAHGILAKVNKRREVYLIDNVRVHLDEVEGLGQFIEFEAVMDSKSHTDAEIAKIETLIVRFRIDRKNLLSQSYLDMVLAREV